MKKKVLIIVSTLFVILIVFLIFRKISFNNFINNTINYSNKINHNQNIELILDNEISNYKIKYDVIKSSNIKKIILENYKNKKLENSIEKYIINEKGKSITYVNEDNEYKKQSKTQEDFYVRYNLLKKAKIKNHHNNTYKLKMKAYDAYNLIYKKDVMKKNDLNFNIIVTVKKDNKTNFIKEISYKIDNINKDKEIKPISYKLKIVNTKINNNDKIDLPFEK